MTLRSPRFRAVSPGLDLDIWVPKRGGRFRVLETLSGPSAPMWIEVKNDLKTSDTDSTYAPPRPVTYQMRLGECWIVVYDTKTKKADQGRFGTTWLNGPDDPLLLAYRCHLAWLARKDRQQVYDEIRATVLNDREPPAARYGAWLSLFVWADPSLYNTVKSPDLPRVQRLMMELLTQPGLSAEWRQKVLCSIQIDASKEIAPGSDAAFLLRYLLDVVEKETDPLLVGQAADRLYFINNQSATVDSKYTAFYFPEITQALEKRDREDEAQGPDHPRPASGALSNLGLAGRRRLEDIKDVPVVVRHLP
jgi:hypothetical protein